MNIEDIFEMQSRDTNMISVGISWNTDISSVRQMIVREMNTASNIKSKSTRKGVLKALKKIDGLLSVVKNPKNGIIIFASNDLLWTFEPELPLCVNFYECGKKFRTDEIIDSFKNKERIGLVEISLKEAIISQKQGVYKQVRYIITSGLPSQHNQGGQSQQRFLRKFWEEVGQYCKRVKEYMNKVDVERWEISGNERLITLIE